MTVSGEGFTVGADDCDVAMPPNIGDEDCTFRIDFLASTPGISSGEVTIRSDGIDPFTFAVSATTLPPDIGVFFGQTSIESDDAPSSGAGTDFGNVSLGETSAPATFTIQNTGSPDVKIASVTLCGTPSDFGLNATSCPGETALANGESCTIAVTVTPSGVGDRSATVVILSDDEDEATFNLLVQATGVGPFTELEGAGLTGVAGSSAQWGLRRRRRPGHSPDGV